MSQISALDAPNPAGDFSRQDESDDAIFYGRPRMVSHLDSKALQTLERIIGDLLDQPDRPGQPGLAVLDLMASWDSHLPAGLKAARVVGLGLNQDELAANPRLTDRVVRDLNRDPRLPFPDGDFDAVLISLSVDYLIDPLAVFSEVGRVLKPGGLFLVSFSNRWFEPKVTNVWRSAGEMERIILVEDWLRQAGLFTESQAHLSKGQPRPADDKYAGKLPTSDPVWAVFAEARGGAAGRPARRVRPLGRDDAPPAEELARRLAQVGRSLACPHCGQPLSRWRVPQTPFTEWDNEFMHVCFNDQCPYLLAGWEAMSRQGNLGVSYRFMYNPENGSTLAIPILSLAALKDGIMD